MKPTQLARWAVYCAVVAVALASVRQTERADIGAAVHTGQVTATHAGPAATREGAGLPGLDLALLRERSQRDPERDPFNSQTSDESEEKPAEQPAAPVPPPPEAPPLPFSFFGKLVDGGRTTVFLAMGDQNFAVRSGDAILGNYRVEEIGEQSMTLAYLPSGSKQTLAIGSASTLGGESGRGAPTPDIPAPLAADAPPTHDLTKLVWTAPSQIQVGEEFTVEVGLPAGSEPRSGRLELLYDGLVLALLGGATPQGPARGTTQRAVVEVIGPGFRGGQPTPSEVRFLVLAGTPTKTQLGIENLVAKLATGATLAVESPKSHQLAIVEPPRK